ncbi:MAG: hypothetical protein RLZZ546_128 [Bacteroidota bacterium]|jgi:uncharacterized protein YuzE
MRNIQVFVFILIVYNSVKSQKLYNISNDYDLLLTSAELLAEDRKYYYTIGYAEKMGESEVGFMVSAHDKLDGRVLHTTYYKKPGEWLFTGRRTPVFLKGQELIFGIDATKYLYKFSYNINSHSITPIDSVKNESSGGLVITDMIIGNDTTYYFASLTLPDSNALLLAIKKDDEPSNNIYLPQEKGYFYSTSKLSVLSDGTIIATGGKRKNIDDQIFISELDKDGNLIKEVNNLISDRCYRVADLELINDSTLLIDAACSYYPFFYNTIYKYNINQRKFIWKYRNDTRPTEWYNHGGEIIKGHRENEFLFCTVAEGIGTKPDSIFNVGQVVKIDGNGKKLWSKDYARYSGQNLAFNHFATIMATSDGSYLVGGEARIQRTEAWLVKIDEDGNILPIDTTTATSITDITDIKIYPNPASDYLIINQGEQTVMSYHLLDMTGREAAKIDIQSSHTNVMWELDEVSSGMYILVIKQKGKILESKKIVVR